ncbi:hypothetical protein BDD12DRAFT_916993 [Trichophaea hybrida]|nr:hypothetical protein BDD12DRAFT_916993 [Trichophaea hybrida]
MEPPSPPSPPTSATVAAILQTYLSTLASQNLTLPPHHLTLLTTFLTTLLTSPNPLETILPPPTLLTTSTPQSLHIGTGLSITQSLASAIASAKHSVLFSTCFWASSASRDILSDSLRQLSQHTPARRVTVRICFSSSSLLQKLLHTSSPQGKTHPASSWASLGLPTEEELSGLDMTVKSLFFTPFSVMHSKFCIIDSNLLFLPSSNISWEVWLEQCTTFTGPIVSLFSTFWQLVWGTDNDDLPHPLPFLRILSLPPKHLLPPRIPHEPPQTPQNVFILSLLDAASNSVFLQTPNLTSRPLLRALEATLERGVTVEIVTCRRMMVVEQFVTTAASASTEGCVAWLIQRSGGRLGIWEDGVVVSPTACKAVKSHVKALIVDGEVTVLGSANADRASWYTSQEVNVGVFSGEFAGRVRGALVRGLGGRLERVAGGWELRG